MTEIAPPADYRWPDAILFLGDDCSLYRPQQHTGTALDSLSVTVFTARKSRAYPEHDLPAPREDGAEAVCPAAGPARHHAPAAAGRRPRRHRLAQRLVRRAVDLRRPWPATANRSFTSTGWPPTAARSQRLTDGPFHDIDPAELPDGRIAFTSTRIGMFDEYHCPPARALFAMNPDGSDIHPLTHTFIFDNEPEVLADGRILFIRSDNFFDRGKVETLLHAIHPDGTEGYTEFGLDHGPGVRRPAAGVPLRQPRAAARRPRGLRLRAGDHAGAIPAPR